MPVHTHLLEFRHIPKEKRVWDVTTSEGIFDLVRATLGDIPNFQKFPTPNWKLLKKSHNHDHEIITAFYEGPMGCNLTIRLYMKTFIGTVTLEYYLDSNEPLLTYEQCKNMELQWVSLRSYLFDARAMASTTPASLYNTIPSILRGTSHGIYFPTMDKRILQYDIDAMVYDSVSPFQNIQIAHSKTYGNMLILDGDPNLAESDLIYTHSIMKHGMENYKGKEILILGGGDGGLLHELLKEKPKHVIMIEIDEKVIEACKTHMRSVCGNALDNLVGENYEIIIDDCRPRLLKLKEEGARFDYIFDDLTTIPVNGNTNEDKSLFELQKSVLESACCLLRENTGKLMAHGPGADGLNSTQLFEEILKKSVTPPHQIRMDKQIVFVPSFMESWAFYQVQVGKM